MNSKGLILLLISLTASTVSHHSHWEACPELKVMESIDLQNFTGLWYQHASYGNMFLHGLDKCVSTNYSLSDDKVTVIMENQRQLIKSNTLLETTWTAVVSNETDPNGNFTLTLQFPIFGSREVSLLVVGTDYQNYAVMFVCGRVSFLKFVAGYIFTRKKKYSTDGFAKIKKDVEGILKDNKYSFDQFSVTKQDDCDTPATVGQTMASIISKGIKFAISTGGLALLLG